MENVKVEPLIWACEVIFFSVVKRLPENALRIIEQDALKVKATLEHEAGCGRFCKIVTVLVFTSHSAREASNLRQQIVRLRKKHKLDIILSIASPEET